MRVPVIPLFYRAIDYLMVPVMFVLGGFKADSMQETHPWHVFRDFKLDDVDRSMSVSFKGTEKQGFSRRFLFLFHAPLFGGWKNYIVLESVNYDGVFHVGWIVYDQGVLQDYGINKLPIVNGAIRMLEGPPNYNGCFFGVGSDGSQIPLKKAGNGRLGDKKYLHIRLF